MARRIRSRMGLEHFEQRSNVLWNKRKALKGRLQVEDATVRLSAHSQCNNFHSNSFYPGRKKVAPGDGRGR